MTPFFYEKKNKLSIKTVTDQIPSGKLYHEVKIQNAKR